jgi:CheY-like chemotaxis protein
VLTSFVTKLTEDIGKDRLRVRIKPDRLEVYFLINGAGSIKMGKIYQPKVTRDSYSRDVRPGLRANNQWYECCALERPMAEKILVVEDDCISLKNLSLYLLMSGYDVEEASDGLQALQKLEREKFDLVLSDIKMPRFDGYSLTKHVCASFPATPIILMTADPPEQPGTVAAEAGARHMLTKPLVLDQLLEKITEVLSSKHF